MISAPYTSLMALWGAIRATNQLPKGTTTSNPGITTANTSNAFIDQKPAARWLATTKIPTHKK